MIIEKAIFPFLIHHCQTQKFPASNVNSILRIHHKAHVSEKSTYSYGAGHQPSAFTIVVFQKQENASANNPRKHGDKETHYEPGSMDTARAPVKALS